MIHFNNDATERDTFMLQQFVLPAMSFALSATTVPGPLTAYIVNTTLTHGWRKALLVVLAPLITDAPIIILMTFILGKMPPEVLNIIRIGGGGLLLYIAYGAWQQYRSDTVFDSVDEASKNDSTQSWQRVMMTGVMMNYLSPGPYLFWATVNGPLLISALEISVGHALVFLMAFYGTFLIGLSGWVLLFHKIGQANDRYLRIIILLTIGLLIWFGTSLIMSAIGLDQYHPILVMSMIALFIVIRYFFRAKSINEP